jgi:major membrane immunogen (membrane-anchored lipoprotein)
MELLKQLLAESKLSFTDLTAEVQALGYDPDNLTDDETLKIADLLKSRQGSKMTTPAKNTKNALPSNSAEKATDKAVQKVDAMVSRYQQLADKVVEAKSAKIIEIIEDIPNATMARVRQL